MIKKENKKGENMKEMVLNERKKITDLFRDVEMPLVEDIKLQNNKENENANGLSDGNTWDNEPLSYKVNGHFSNKLITVKDLYNKLKTLIPFFEGKEKPTIFLLGPPGVGKTDIILQVAKEYRLKVQVYIASTMDPTQVMGVPFPNREKGTTEWYIDERFVVPNKGEGYIFFFDEINMAPPSIQSALYQLILTGRLGKIDISMAWRIGAGNRITDFENVQRMGLPMATRFQLYFIKPDIETWLDWAVENNINDFILYYLYQVSIQMKVKKTDDDPRWFYINTELPGLARATPRTWARLSMLMDAGLDSKEDITGALGAIPGTHFYEWYTKAKAVVKNGEVKYEKGVRFKGYWNSKKEGEKQ